MKPTLAFLPDDYWTLLYPHRWQTADKASNPGKYGILKQDEEWEQVRAFTNDLKHFSKIADMISQERFIKICKSYAWLPVNYILSGQLKTCLFWSHGELSF